MPKSKDSILSVIDCCYWQQNGEGENTDFTNRFEYRITSEEEPLRRKLRVSPHGVSLNTYWLEDRLSMVLLHNPGKEKVYIEFGEETALVLPPGTSTRIFPAASVKIMFHSENETTIETTMFPRSEKAEFELVEEEN